jgi:hypothetical protein
MPGYAGFGFSGGEISISWNKTVLSALLSGIRRAKKLRRCAPNSSLSVQQKRLQIQQTYQQERQQIDAVITPAQQAALAVLSGEAQRWSQRRRTCRRRGWTLRRDAGGAQAHSATGGRNSERDGSAQLNSYTQLEFGSDSLW